MPSVAELTAVYGNLMLAPRSGPDVCDVCFTFTDGFQRCYVCAHTQQWLDAVLPISYSVGLEQLHHVLRMYKRENGEAARRLRVELAAVLWRFLERHERCLARSVGIAGFDLVTTVPSSDRRRDEHHPLRWIVGSLVTPTRERHDRLLRRTATEATSHELDTDRFAATRNLERASVLLIDDTWTTGANAHSAAQALKRAGAASVAAVVIGRHLNREWRANDKRLRKIERPFDWGCCALCAPSGAHATAA